MIYPGGNPDGDEKAYTESVSEQLAQDLRIPIDPENPRTSAKRRLTACRKVHELATEDPEIAREYFQLVVDVLQREVAYTAKSTSASEMVVRGGLSAEIQDQSVQTLIRLLDIRVIQELEQGERGITPLISALSLVIVARRSESATRESVKALGKISMWRPASVAEVIASEFDTDQICQSVSAELNNEVSSAVNRNEQTPFLRLSVRLLAVLLTHHQGPISTPDQVEDVLTAARVPDIDRTRVYADIALTALRGSYTSFPDAIRSARSLDGVDRKRAGRSIGEAMAARLLPEEVEGLTRGLLVQIRNTSGELREAACWALGEMRIVDAESILGLSSVLEPYILRSDVPTGLQRRAAQALGMVAMAEPERVPGELRSLVEQVRVSDDIDLAAATWAIGKIRTMQPDVWFDMLATLQRRIQESTGEQKAELADVFAEVLLIDPDLAPDAVRPLVNQVRKTQPIYGTGVARSLAIATVVTPEGASSSVPSLIDFANSGDGTERQWAKQAIGELIHADPSVTPRTVKPIVDSILTSERIVLSNNELRTRLIGTIVIDEPETPVEAIGPYINYVIEAEEGKRWNALKILGDVVQDLAGINAGDVTQLISFVKDLGRPERIAALTAVGETIVRVPDIIPSAFRPLVTHLDQTAGQRRDRIARAIGEVEIRQLGSPEELVNEYLRMVRTLSGPSRWITAQELGEVLSMFPNAAPVMCQPLIESVERLPNQYCRPVVLALGEVAAVIEGTPDSPVQALKEYMDGVDGIVRRFRAQVLGEFVLAKGEDIPEPSKRIVEHIRAQAWQTEDEQKSTTPILPGTGESALESKLILEELSLSQSQWSRQTLVECLGEVTAGRVDDYVERKSREVIYKRASNSASRTFPLLLRYDIIAPERLITTLIQVGEGQPLRDLDIIRTDIDSGLNRYLQSTEPGRQHVLKAVAQAMKEQPNIEHTVTIREQVQEFLTSSRDLPPGTRIVAIEILTAIGGTNTA